MATVYFVCTGNTCRSPMAEGFFKHHARLAGMDTALSARSGGIYPGGARPSEGAVVALGNRGIDISGHVSSQIDSIALHGADLILTMTSSHMEQVLEYIPEVSGKVFVLGDFVATLDNLGEEQTTKSPDPAERLLALRDLVATRLEGESTHYFYVRDIADPYGGSPADYEHTAAAIEKAVLRLVDALSEGND